MFYNEMEVEDICGTLARSGNKKLTDHALILAGWVNVVNTNSDGWPYWKTGSGAAGQLVGLLARAAGKGTREEREAYWRGERWEPSDADLRKALSPMKACATKHKLPSPLAPLERLAEQEVKQREREVMIGMYVGGQLPKAPKPAVKQGQLALFEDSNSLAA